MNYFLIKGLGGEEMPDTKMIKLVDEEGVTSTIPADPKNRHYAAYLAWKAEDPENNVAQSEPE